MSATTQTVRRMHTLAGFASAVAAFLFTMQAGAVPAAAHEPSPTTGTAATGASWYAVPVASLGGRTLAQYVADHESTRLGLFNG